ncbi:hypothetical protein F2Q69_00027951 [Brassica cretica]|uniref:Uncharacterized protein n=1 Tax=Brassica cretica TaxID=69181 RepID=A0A8S9RYD5_BRACR|nr:hypothetical protein F2Q69_00027951 [Brassica cretica]
MQRSDGRSETDASTAAKGAESATEKWQGGKTHNHENSNVEEVDRDDYEGD